MVTDAFSRGKDRGIGQNTSTRLSSAQVLRACRRVYIHPTPTHKIFFYIPLAGLGLLILFPQPVERTFKHPILIIFALKYFILFF